MNNPITAQVNTVQLPVGKTCTSVRRNRPVKPYKPLVASTVGEFEAENALRQLEHFYKEMRAKIVNRTLVSLNVDEVGANMTFIGSDFQLSMIYTEGGIAV